MIGRVFWTDFKPGELSSDRFTGFVKSWKRLVDEHVELSRKSLPTDPDITKLGLAKLLSLMTVPQIWGLIAAIVSLLGSIATIAFKLGGGKWPWRQMGSPSLSPRSTRTQSPVSAPLLPHPP